MALNIFRLISAGFANALGVFLYVLAAAWVMDNLSNVINAGGPDWLKIAGVLMLLVLSVTVVGLFIFAWPVILWQQGQRKIAVYLELATVGSLFLLTAIALMLNIVL